jgi:hypothetical protein
LGLSGCDPLGNIAQLGGFFLFAGHISLGLMNNSLVVTQFFSPAAFFFRAEADNESLQK